MPQIIRDLRWHGNVLPAAFQMRQEELSQAVRNQLAFLGREMRVVMPKSFEQSLGQNKSTNIGLSAQRELPLPEESTQRHEQNAGNGGDDGHL